jgi:hypothetical protein
MEGLVFRRFKCFRPQESKAGTSFFVTKRNYDLRRVAHRQKIDSSLVSLVAVNRKEVEG